MDSGWFGELWRTFTAHWATDLLILVGTPMMAFLRRHREQWAAPVMYGIVTAVCIAAMSYFFTGRTIFSPPLVDESNIEANLKQWMIDYGDGVESAPLANLAFRYRVTLRDGLVVVVSRDATTRPDTIQLETDITIGPQHKAILAQMTPDEATVITGQIATQLFAQKISNSWNGTDANHIEDIWLATSAPIRGLTSYGFMNSMDSLTSAVSLTRTSLQVSMRQYVMTHTAPSTPKPLVRPR